MWRHTNKARRFHSFVASFYQYFCVSSLNFLETSPLPLLHDVQSVGLPRCLRLNSHRFDHFPRHREVLNLDPLHGDAPGIAGHAEGCQNGGGDLLPGGEEGGEGVGAQDRAQRGAGQALNALGKHNVL